MTTRKQFVIVIPAYNYANYLPRALRSALDQPGDDYEVVVIDDGSTDDTREVMQSWLDRYPARLRYIYQDNRGLSGARNRGIDESRATYLIFLDADDEMCPDALDHFRRFLEGRNDVDMCFGAYYSVMPDGSRRLRKPPVLSRDKFQNFRDYVKGRIHIANGAIAIHRRVFERIRYPESVRNNQHYMVDGQMLALFSCHTFPEPVLQVHAHGARQRKNLAGIQRTGLRIVDLLFDENVLPPVLMRYRREFLSRILLSRFRSHYQAGYYRDANRMYLDAIKVRPTSILLFSYTRKFLRSVVKSLMQGSRSGTAKSA